MNGSSHIPGPLTLIFVALRSKTTHYDGLSGAWVLRMLRPAMPYDDGVSWLGWVECHVKEAVIYSRQGHQSWSQRECFKQPSDRGNLAKRNSVIAFPRDMSIRHGYDLLCCPRCSSWYVLDFHKSRLLRTSWSQAVAENSIRTGSGRHSGCMLKSLRPKVISLV